MCPYTTKSTLAVSWTLGTREISLVTRDYVHTPPDACGYYPFENTYVKDPFCNEKTPVSSVSGVFRVFDYLLVLSHSR